MGKKAETFEYRLPEDYAFTKEQRLRFDGMVDECGLTEVQAQRFIDFHIERMEELADNLEELHGSNA